LNNCPEEIKYFIDDIEVKRSLLGKIKIDHFNKPLLFQDQNLLENVDFKKSGFIVKDFVDENKMDLLLNKVFEFLSDKFEIEINRINYNDVFKNMKNKIFHKKMEKIYKGIKVTELPFSLSFIENWVSDNLNKKLKLFSNFEEQTFLIRVVRPFSQDFNPPHRDVYIDRLRNAVNCFFPLIGVNSKSSLPIIPGSHYWPESETIRTELNPTIDGLNFSVPSILYKKNMTPIVLTRPKVKKGQIMFFSPYCIHGGGINLGSETRISFEMRFKLNN